MLEKKKESIFPLYEAIGAYSNYLLKSTSGQDCSNEIEVLKNKANYALLALISLNLVFKKEDLVTKSNEPKLYDFVLDDYMSIIKAHNNLDLETPENTFSKIRHKLAHGDFYLDGNNVVLNIENSPVETNIYVLSKLVSSLTHYYYDYAKEKDYERYFVIDKATGSQIAFEEKNIDTILKMLSLKRFKLSNLNGQDIPIHIKKKFRDTVDNYKHKLIKNEAKQMDSEIINDFYNIGYNVSTTNSKIKNTDEIRKIASSIITCCPNLSDKEKKYVFADILEKINDPNYNKDIIWLGSYWNQQIIEKLIMSESFDFDYLYRICHFDLSFTTSELYVSCLLAQFNSLYSYPLDDLFKIDNSYRLEEERQNEFNFQNLNLENLNPNILNIEIKAIDEMKKQIISLEKRISDISKTLSQKTDSYNKVNDEIKLKIKPAIETLTQNLNLAKENYVTLKNRYKKAKNDIIINEKHFKNRAIIEGIRNALAHGNVSVIDLFSADSFQDIKLNFKDYDDDELCMDLTISLKDFNTLFNQENVDAIKDFINTNSKTK